MVQDPSTHLKAEREEVEQQCMHGARLAQRLLLYKACKWHDGCELLLPEHVLHQMHKHGDELRRIQ